MAITYNLAPQPNWRFFYPASWTDASLAGTPLVNGQIYTYESIAHTTPKSTWSDPSGMTLQANPIILNANGEPSLPIYWALDDSDQTNLYYFEVRSPATLSSPMGTLLYAFDKFDGSELFLGTPEGSPDDRNFLSNAQFRFWSSGTIFSITSATSTLIADDWYLVKDSVDGAITVKQVANSTSLTIDGYSPTPFGLEMNITSAGTAGYIGISKQINDVYTLSGLQITISVRVKLAAGSSSLQLRINQNFGTNGSSSQVNLFPLSPAVTTSFQVLSTTITVPSISGNTVGTLGDDYIQFQIVSTTQVAGDFTLEEPQIQIGSTVNDFQYQSKFDDTYQMLPTFLGFQTGWMLHGQMLPSIPGWVILRDNTIGDSSSNATARANTDCYNLFILLWNTFNEFSCPLFTSTGLLISKATDANAAAAWAAHRAISVPRLSSRTLGITGLGIFDSIVTFSSSSGLLATLTSSGAATTNLVYTGTQISFLTNGATLPTGITNATIYYAIYDSSTTFRIATTLANAIAGTAIIYTDSGSGTIRFHAGYLARSLGDMAGQDTHLQITAEVGQHLHAAGTHTHGQNGLDNANTPATSVNNIIGTLTGTLILGTAPVANKQQILTDVSAGNVANNTAPISPFNITQPTTYLNSFIKL